MATFPSSLFPLIDADNYASAEGYPVIRTEMDTGPPKRRRRFTAAVRRRRLSMLCDETERETFRTFYRVDCFQGAGTFQMQDPEFAATKIITFGFASAPTIDAVEQGLYWRITLDLEEMP